MACEVLTSAPGTVPDMITLSGLRDTRTTHNIALARNTIYMCCTCLHIASTHPAALMVRLRTQPSAAAMLVAQDVALIG